VKESKAQLGADRLWWWLSPAPISSGTTPALALDHSDVATVAPIMVAIADEGNVSSIDRDRVSLTLSAPIAAIIGSIGGYGEAWYVTATDGYFPVHVARINGTAVTLANPLPRGVEGAGTLQFRRWHTTLKASEVTGTARRNWTTRVSYVAVAGAGLPTWVSTDEGLLHVVRQPFDTALDTDALLGWFPDLALLAPGRQQDFAEQIDRASSVLVSRLRLRLRESANPSATEDECDGSALQQAHAALTAAVIYQLRDAELAAQLREVALDALDLEVAAMWVDADKDGTVDDGENPADTANATTLYTSSAFAGVTRRFSAGQAH